MLNENTISTVQGKARETVAAYALAPHDVEDAVSVATVAAIEAEETYDADKGASLDTWCVSAGIFAVKNWLKERQYTVVPLPRKLGEQWQRATIVRTKLAQELLREPTNAEVAEALEMTIEQYEALRTKADYEQGILEDLVGTEDDDGEDMSYEEVLVASEWEEPEFLVSLAQDRSVTQIVDRVYEQLALMDPQESDVLRRYFGLGGQEPQTLREIEEATDTPRTTVNRVLHRGLEHLRGRLTLMGVDFDGIRLA